MRNPNRFMAYGLLLAAWLTAGVPAQGASSGGGVRVEAGVSAAANVAAGTARTLALGAADTTDGASGTVILSGMVYRQEYDALIPVASSLAFHPTADSSGNDSSGVEAVRTRAPEGVYRVRLEPGSYDVEITPARDSSRVFRFPGVFVPEVDSMLDFRLEKVGVPEQGTRVYGVVSDSASGKPLEGAEVVLAVERRVLARVRTDTAGAYEFFELQADVPHFVQAAAKGYRPATRRVELQVGEEAEVPFPLSPMVTGVVQGRVVSGEGEPLEGAVLSLIPVEGTRGGGAARSGADGRWRAEAPEGTYVVAVVYAAADSGEHAPVPVRAFFDGAETFEKATPVRVAADSVTDAVDFVLKLPTWIKAALTGTVRDTAGTPLADATVAAYATRRTAVGTFTHRELTRSGADGSWRLAMQVLSDAPEVKIGAFLTGYVPQFHEGADNLEQAETITLRDGAVVEGVDFRLTPVGREARHAMGGVVTGGDSAGVAQALVLAFSKSSGLATALSDSAGRYRFDGLPDGVYHLLFVAQGYLPAFHPGTLDWMRAESVDLREDRLDLRTVLRAVASFSQGGAGAVNGTVRGPDGSPLSGATVAVIDSTGAPVHGAMSGFAGKYALSGLPAGKYTLQASRVGYLTWNAPLALTADGAMSHSLDIVLDPAESATSTEGPGAGGSAEQPGAFRLEPNIPNPFNPSTTLRFTLPAAGPVRLDVFDLNGRRVRVLLDEVRSAGSHQVIFEAGELPSGSYVARLTTTAGTASRLMTLIK